MGLRKFLRRFRLKSVQAGESQRSVDNVDAMASMAQSRGAEAMGGSGAALFPPDYVKDDDDGRPRH
jgi:hypothetical protein